MAARLRDIIVSNDPKIRNESLEHFCATADGAALLRECADLDQFRRSAENLYERVRALFFLYAIYRFHLPTKLPPSSHGHIPFEGYTHLLERRFEEAIDYFLETAKKEGANDSIASALATAYHRLAFQTLANQVRRSVRSVSGNRWMFRMGHPADQPLRIRQELLERDAEGLFPVLRESTPVRMDLTHSAWSDIFFLGMDYPEGARVLNVSIDLGVKWRDKKPKPPVEAYLRVIEEPLLRLTSVDLQTTADITSLSEVFDFAKDYLGLLKAAIIAAGIVPPGVEGSGHSLGELLSQIVGPGRGLEIVSNVNDIPKGSRLAVSTNLLGSLISVCMRATGQAESLTGALQENERRLIAARAILGEWLGGSGGGWQDSGGVWPGIKLIQGEFAHEGDPEFGVSRGRLLPKHQILDEQAVPRAMREKLQESLVLVHGGMAQNVGPILEMVTEKYLLRSEQEWQGRQEALGILDEILAALKSEDVQRLGQTTTRNFTGPIQTIIPWASNYYTESLIAGARREFGSDFWGFWMLGGMSGGGMGFMFAPAVKDRAQERLQVMMRETRKSLERALPFAMEPVVYDFAINERGSFADLLEGPDALMPRGYYTILVPRFLAQDRARLKLSQRAELDQFAAACRTRPELGGMVQDLFDHLFPRTAGKGATRQSVLQLLDTCGFDRLQHEQIRNDLRAGRIGLAQNRLPVNAAIEDVRPEDVLDFTSQKMLDKVSELERLGTASLRNGEVAVVTLAAGAGSRWTQGAGVIKALHPFARFQGKHRTFIEAHLAKSRKASRSFGVEVPHVFTTSYLTHAGTVEFLARHQFYNYKESLFLSEGRSVGLRFVPMVRDLRFLWEEMPQQVLDEQAQKVRDSLRTALIGWAAGAGEGSDYTDNLPQQCLHPVGHWFEIPNLLRNGTLAGVLQKRPGLRYLLLHNIDTLGADLSPALLGAHIREQACLSFEVISRRVDDRGGGLARVDGRPRLVEGLAMPREEDEFHLSYYNTMTTWIDIDQLLQAFGITRSDLQNPGVVAEAIRQLATKMPTYITLKDVKKRWGHGQEDVFPVAQFEKLWGDMTALPEVNCRFFVVPRLRGQQLKEQAQLDGWLRDGSGAYIDSISDWE